MVSPSAAEMVNGFYGEKRYEYDTKIGTRAMIDVRFVDGKPTSWRLVFGNAEEGFDPQTWNGIVQPKRLRSIQAIITAETTREVSF